MRKTWLPKGITGRSKAEWNRIIKEIRFALKAKKTLPLIELEYLYKRGDRSEPLYNKMLKELKDV